MKAGGQIGSVAEFLLLAEADHETGSERLRFDTASPEIWQEIILRHPEWKRTVAANKRLDHRTLRLLAGDEDPAIRLDVAFKNTFPSDLFEHFASDEDDESVRGRIALHPKIPLEILKRLAVDRSEWVSERATECLAQRSG
ncbi:MAG: leucine rich repeat variant [Akkermansiaceae bacterium]|nr:leucine rich repeat variant [Akkermansiaceae bacterium]